MNKHLRTVIYWLNEVFKSQLTNIETAIHKLDLIMKENCIDILIEFFFFIYLFILIDTLQTD